MTATARRAGARFGLACALAVAVSSVASAVLAAPAPPIAGLLPVAVDDTLTAVHGQLRTVASPGVLKNDLQLGGGFTAALVSGTSHGNVDLDPKGGYTYRSDDDYVGSDQFRYRVDGGLLGLSNIATVRITVTNHAPVAHPDAYTAVADVERSIPAPGVLANDDDQDGDALTVDIVSEPDGNLNERDDGSFRYKADADFAGTDTFTYRVWDGVAWSATVNVTIDVTGPTPKPTTAPTPTPALTPTPAPTTAPTTGPTATPRPSATAAPTTAPTTGPTTEPTSRPTATPRATAPPSATPSQRPSAVPGSTPTPSPASTQSSPSASPTASPPGSATPTGSADPAGPSAGGAGTTGGGPATGGGDTTSGGPDAAGSAVRPQVGAFSVAAAEPGGDLRIDAASVAFGSFEWAVPALVLTVPGLLLILAVVAQATIGLAFLPVARRWLGDDHRRRGPPGRPATRS